MRGWCGELMVAMEGRGGWCGELMVVMEAGMEAEVSLSAAAREDSHRKCSRACTLHSHSKHRPTKVIGCFGQQGTLHSCSHRRS